MFGTGFRNRSSLSAVSVRIGNQAAEVTYAGPQGYYWGLDQINVRLPRSLAGAGVVDIVPVVDGKEGNTVQVQIR